MKIIKMALAVASVLFAVNAASAATMTAQYEATNAVGNGANHSLWLATSLNGNKSYTFSPAGVFTLYDDGTGSLTGTAYANNDAASGFQVSFQYDDPTFSADFKSENGSAAGADIFYKFLTGGTLTGYGAFQGLNLVVSAMPAYDGVDDGDDYAVQIGSSNGSTEGPNNKNMNFGMAHWMSILADAQTCSSQFCFEFGNRVQGDINVDLKPVPLPASAFLLFGGLAALAAGKRRRA